MYSQGPLRAVSTTAGTAMSCGFQSRPNGEPASASGASGASAATVQLVLDTAESEGRRLVQSRARHGPAEIGRGTGRIRPVPY